jgi:hypothetical protein
MIKGLTVKELREAKSAMEINIMDSIRDEIIRFTQRTGISVEGMELTFVDTRTKDHDPKQKTHVLVNVNTELNLE